MEDNTSAKFEFLASFILPNGILDWFDFVKANEEPVEKKDCIYKSTLHIYLDEKDNRTNEHLLLVHSYDIDPHSYDVDPLEEGRAFKEQSLFACKQAAA